MIDAEKTIIWLADQVQKMDVELEHAQDEIKDLRELVKEVKEKRDELALKVKEQNDLNLLREKLSGTDLTPRVKQLEKELNKTRTELQAQIDANSSLQKEIDYHKAIHRV